MSSPIKALLFTATSGYRHACISSLAQALARLPSVDLTHTESLPTLIDILPSQDVLILGHNTGEYLNDEGKQAVRNFVEGYGNEGGDQNMKKKGVMGVHAATSGMKKWEWYGEMLGGAFSEHPDPQWGVVRLHHRRAGEVGEGEDGEHFILRNLPKPSSSSVTSSAPPSSSHSATAPTDFPWFDEWYNFNPEPRIPPKDGTVLLSVDKMTYEGWNGREDGQTQHPLAWCRETRGGTRVFYTALGHFEEAYEDPWFMAMLERGILWTARRDA